MKWTFTSDQVAKGDIDYSLEEFRRDLYDEVKDNFSDYTKDKLDGMFRLAYDVCYSEATRGNLDAMVSHYREKGLPLDRKYLEMIRDSNRDNSAMLKALLAAELAKLTQQGLSGEEALKRLEERHSDVASQLPGT